MYDYERLTREAEALADRYEICRLSCAGESLCRRSLHLLSIGNGSIPVLYAGTFHGLEWITAAVLLHFCRRLCQAQQTGLTVCGIPVRELLQKITLFCIPMVNPDGAEIVQRGEKSAGSYAAVSAGRSNQWQANARGVDINHNFDAGWHVLHEMEQKAGIIGPGPTRYGGEFPESEPESAAIASLCRRIPFVLAMAFHTQGEEIYWQYGDHTPGISREIAESLAEISGYRTASPQGLASMGGFKDWFIDFFQRPAFTVEMGKGKNPLPFSKLFSIEYAVFPMMMRGLAIASEHPV